MKKLLLCLCLFFILTACSDKPVENEVDYSELTREEQISYEVEKISKELSNTTINEIKVNDHLGTEDPNDFIVLVYLSFNAKNRAGTAKDMIDMYNNELGAKLAELNDITELTFFWEVPYLKDGENIAKANLIRENENMVFEEKWFNGQIFN